MSTILETGITAKQHDEATAADEALADRFCPKARALKHYVALAAEADEFARSHNFVSAAEKAALLDMPAAPPKQSRMAKWAYETGTVTCFAAIGVMLAWRG